MGKYMKKAKIASDITDFSQSSMGVCTRAKTLALQRLLVTSPKGAPNLDTSYLQLRSRRLVKTNPSPNPNKIISSRKSRLGCFRTSSRVVQCGNSEAEGGDFNDLGVQDCFGENNLEFENRERSARECTPCSFSISIETPGSTTRPTSSGAKNRRGRSAIQRNVPTSWEMEDFFACAEQQQEKQFSQKYNFDFVNDSPLPGCYDWVSVNE